MRRVRFVPVHSKGGHRHESVFVLEGFLPRRSASEGTHYLVRIGGRVFQIGACLPLVPLVSGSMKISFSGTWTGGGFGTSLSLLARTSSAMMEHGIRPTTRPCCCLRWTFRWIHGPKAPLPVLRSVPRRLKGSIHPYSDKLCHLSRLTSHPPVQVPHPTCALTCAMFSVNVVRTTVYQSIRYQKRKNSKPLKFTHHEAPTSHSRCLRSRLPTRHVILFFSDTPANIVVHRMSYSLTYCAKEGKFDSLPFVLKAIMRGECKPIIDWPVGTAYDHYLQLAS